MVNNWIFKSLLYFVISISLKAHASYWDKCKAVTEKSCEARDVRDVLRPVIQYIGSDTAQPLGETVSFRGGQFVREIKAVEPDATETSYSDVQVEIDPSIQFNEIWGFGASITDSCLANIEKMLPDKKRKLMQDLFGRNPGAGFSYLRVPLGANDYSDGSYSLNDTEGNRPDPKLEKFNKVRLQKVIGFVKEAKALNPDLKVMVSPWSPPAWMKDTKKLEGGQLRSQYQKAYARYLEKSVQTFQEQGVQVDHMTVLNEPLISWAKEKWDFPQGYMSVRQQKDFIANDLGPVARRNKNFPRLLVHDHNWENALHAKELLDDKKIKPLVGGIALHCYGGDFNDEQEALAKFRPMHGFNSECSATLADKNEEETFNWWLKTQSLDSLRAGSAGGLGWNLCLDETGGPRNNGCANCRGLVTIDQKNNQAVKFNPEFEALAFSSRVVHSGAKLVQSNYTSIAGVTNVAFKNPDGEVVALLRNQNDKPIKVSVRVQPCSNTVRVTVPAKSATSIRF